MKQNLIKAILLAVILGTLSTPAYSFPFPDDDKKQMPTDYIIIIVRPVRKDVFRSLVPGIEAFYQNQSICLTFYESIGDAMIVVTNTDTGMQTYEMSDAEDMSASIDISGMGCGNYRIEITTENAIDYTGEFCL